MRIALISTPFVPVPPPAYGGTELVVHELAQGLAARGHQVTLFATGDSRGPNLRFLYRRAVWPPAREVEELHCAAAARLVARGGFDLVHAHAPSYLAVPPGPTPVVYTIHHERDPSLTQLYVRRPDVHYVAISARQAALEPDLACTVVHHGLSPDPFPLGDGGGGYAAFLGRLSACKGPDLAVEAARRAGVPLRIAGKVHVEEGPAEWGARVAALLERPGVEHVGEVGGAAKARFLGGARALLMPLRWEEPFGLVMVEAMLCGTPVLATPRGSAPELVDEGVTGFLVDGPEEMGAVLEGLEGFDREACRARALARFSAGAMLRRYEAVYAAALGTARAAPAAEEPRHVG